MGGWSSSVQLTKFCPHGVNTLARGSPKVTTGSCPFQILRIGGEQHVPDSSNHWLLLMTLFSFRSLEGNKVLDCSIRFRPFSKHNKLRSPSFKSLLKPLSRSQNIDIYIDIDIYIYVHTSLKKKLYIYVVIMNRHGHNNIRIGFLWEKNIPQHKHMNDVIARL